MNEALIDRNTDNISYEQFNKTCLEIDKAVLVLLEEIASNPDNLTLK